MAEIYRQGLSRPEALLLPLILLFSHPLTCVVTLTMYVCYLVISSRSTQEVKSTHGTEKERVKKESLKSLDDVIFHEFPSVCSIANLCLDSFIGR